jgi:hypothetical protein
MRNLLSCGFLAIAAWSSAAWSAPVSAAAPAEAISARCVAGPMFQAGGGEIRLVYDPAAFAIGRSGLCAWAGRAAAAVIAYYGRFPVGQVRIELQPRDGDGMGSGTTWGDRDQGQPLIRIRLGHEVTAAQLQRDWTLTHEMVHLSVPSVPERSHWLEEGIATYVEPIARVQSGELEPAQIWADMLHGMRKGLPQPGDQGLDHTPSWGRTYWGGALFCLMADVRIRERSGNRMGLQDALRGVLAGGDIRSDSTMDALFERADGAVGLPVLSELYREQGAAPMPESADLDSLWRRLGVYADGDGVRFDDRAPLAAVRRAITAPRTAP